MTSDDDYIAVLPDYVYNDVTPTAASKQHRNAVDDDDEKSRDSPVTSPYEHTQPSEAEQQRQTSTYQRVITSQRVPSDHLQPPMTSDMTYDEIGDVPSPPPPRPG